MRAVTSLVDQLERELSAAATARPRDSARYAAVLERAVRKCGADPEAAKVFDLADLYLELATEYQALERWQDALAAADAAVDAGLDMQPDPRCLRAEILTRAGRVDEAEPIWAAVRADTPDDVWLYNNAGLEYAHAGDHDTALRWLTEGLRLALRTGDPERLVDQLADLRQESLAALGRPADALQEQAAMFLHQKRPARPAKSPWLAEPAPEPTDDAVGIVALAWLPAGDYEQAVKLWPELADSELVAGPDGPLPHSLYCRAMQQRLVELSEVGIPGLAVAPVRVSLFTEWCAEQGQQPDSADARAEYAAQLAANADPGVIPWPRGRNQPCWCGSGRKYKKCCAAPSVVDADLRR